jgi:hypothetical protein
MQDFVPRCLQGIGAEVYGGAPGKAHPFLHVPLGKGFTKERRDPFRKVAANMVWRVDWKNGKEPGTLSLR